MKRRPAKLALALCATAALAACQASIPEGTSLTLKVWVGEDSQSFDACKALAEEFDRGEATIQVVIAQKTAIEIAQGLQAANPGEGPDLVLVADGDLEACRAGQTLLAANELMGDDFFRRFVPALVRGGQSDGVQRLVPDHAGALLTLLYNRELMPDPPESWEQLIARGNLLKSQGKVRFPLALCTDNAFFQLPFLLAFGGELCDDPRSSQAQPSLDSPKIGQAMEFLAGLKSQGVATGPLSYEAANALFRQGGAPALVNGYWSYEELGQSLRLGVCPIPAPAGLALAVPGDLYGWGISLRVKAIPYQAEAARRFLAYLATDSAQSRLVAGHGRPSALLGMDYAALEGEHPFLSQEAGLLPRFVTRPRGAVGTALLDSLDIVLQNLWRGLQDPKTAASQAQARAVIAYEGRGLGLAATTSRPTPSLVPAFESSEVFVASPPERIAELFAESAWTQALGRSSTELNQALDELPRPAHVFSGESGENLFEANTFFNLLIESWFNDAEFSGPQARCAIREYYDEFDLERRKVCYGQMREMRSPGVFSVTLRFNAGPRYDFEAGHFLIDGLDIDWREGLVREVALVDHAALGIALRFRDALDIDLDRERAERLRKDESALITIHFEAIRREQEGETVWLSAAPLACAISGAESYYQYPQGDAE